VAELPARSAQKAAIAGIPISTCATQSVTISASESRRRAFAGRSGNRSSAVQ